MPPRNIRETERNSILVDLRRNTSMRSKRHTPRARPERKSAIAGLCRAQAVLAMDDVEGGTRLRLEHSEVGVDALSRTASPMGIVSMDMNFG